MTVTLSLPMRRGVALAVLLMLVACVWSLLVAPLIRLSSDRRDEITDLTVRLDQLRAIAARAPTLKQSAQAVRSHLDSSDIYWRGMTSIVMTAKIQERIRRAISEGGGRLLTTSEVGGSAERGFRRVALRFGVDGTMSTLIKTLSAIEEGKPSLFIDGISILATGSTAIRDRAPSLSFEFTVLGYLMEQKP